MFNHACHLLCRSIRLTGQSLCGKRFNLLHPSLFAAQLLAASIKLTPQTLQPVWKGVALLLTNHLQLKRHRREKQNKCNQCGKGYILLYQPHAALYQLRSTWSSLLCMSNIPYEITTIYLPAKPTVWLQGLVYATMPTVCHARDRFE